MGLSGCNPITSGVRSVVRLKLAGDDPSLIFVSFALPGRNQGWTKKKLFGAKGMPFLVLSMQRLKNGQIERLCPLCPNWLVLGWKGKRGPE